MFEVLIVDDKEVFRRQLKRMPYWKENSEKFRISYEAQNGLEALEILSENNVDVVITDIRMPFIDGIELLKEIHKGNLCRCVILLSEFADFSYAKEGILNGAFDYVLKPVDNEMIEDTFDRAYGFLKAVKETGFKYQKEVEAIAECLFSGEEKKMQKYAGYLNDKIMREERGEHQKFIVEECAERLKQLISDHYDFLDKYLDLDEADELDEDAILSEKIKKYQNAVQSIIPDTKQKMIRKICRSVLENPCLKRSIRSFAEEYFVNAKYLGRSFKQEVGKSYSEYVTFLNICRAKVLLGRSDMKIYEISEEVGYQDVEYFSRVFKKETGESPRAYRERIIHGKEDK